MQLLAARGANPPFLPNFNYLPDQMDHYGTLPAAPVMAGVNVAIDMARHHVIAWNILRDSWNAADLAGGKAEEICTRIYKVMTGAHEIPANAAETNVRNSVCWSPGNLILGPAGGIRLFDPDEDIDFEAPVAMTARFKKRVVLLVRMGYLLKEYESVGGEPGREWLRMFRDVTNQLYINAGDIYEFDRGAWTLYAKCRVTWGMTPTGIGRVGTVQGIWHRAGYSPHVARDVFGPAGGRVVGLPNMTDEEKARLLKNVRSNYEQSLVKEAKWRGWLMNA